MSFIEDKLERGEKITFEVTVSKIAYITALAIFGFSMYPTAIMRLAQTKMALTDRRFIAKTGALGKSVLITPYKNIVSATIRQGILGKIFDYGTIVIMDKNGQKTLFKGIAYPFVVQQEIEEAVEIAILGKKLSEYAPNL